MRPGLPQAPCLRGQWTHEESPSRHTQRASITPKSSQHSRDFNSFSKLHHEACGSGMPGLNHWTVMEVTHSNAFWAEFLFGLFTRPQGWLVSTLTLWLKILIFLISVLCPFKAPLPELKGLIFVNSRSVLSIGAKSLSQWRLKSSSLTHFKLLSFIHNFALRLF